MRVRWRSPGGLSSWTEWTDCESVQPAGNWIHIVLWSAKVGRLGGAVPGREIFLPQHATSQVEIER